MAEPLSSTASVIAVAACAAESTKFLFKFFREFTLAPEHIRQLYTALQSLRLTLIGLQHCGARLDTDWRFPPHFTHRLEDCSRQLNVWTDRIAKLDNVLDKEHSSSPGWKRQTKRSWQRLKWFAVQEHEIEWFLENIRIYQAEFSLELLTILM